MLSGDSPSLLSFAERSTSLNTSCQRQWENIACATNILMIWYFRMPIHRFSLRWCRNFIRCNFPCHLSVHRARVFSLQMCILITQHLSTFCCVTIINCLIEVFSFNGAKSVLLSWVQSLSSLANRCPLGSSYRQSALLQCIRKSKAKTIV